MLHYRVYWKASAASPWVFTGVIEGDREKANKWWSAHIACINYHAFKLEYCTYGAAINR